MIKQTVSLQISVMYSQENVKKIPQVATGNNAQLEIVRSHIPTRKISAACVSITEPILSLRLSERTQGSAVVYVERLIEVVGELWLSIALSDTRWYYIF